MASSNRLVRRAWLLSLGALLLVACRDAKKLKKDAPSDVLEVAAVQGWLTLDAHTALAKLDRDGNWSIDRRDVALLEECIQTADAKTRPECDLVRDGVLDALDVRLLRLLVGHTRAHSKARVAAFADALDAYASEAFAEDMSALFDDHDKSGKSDPGDMRRVAELLRDDPVARWDLDGDGLLGHGDLWELERRARVSDGDDTSADVDGDGTADDADLYLLGDLVHYSSSVVPGVLDRDGNGVVNLADFCMVGGDPLAGATTALRQLMPLMAAEASVAEAPPRVGICRSDGLSYHQHPVSFGVPLSLVVLPENFELVAVDDVPAGYMVPGGLPTGTSYVLRAGDGGPMKHPVESISLPLGGGEGGDEPPAPQLRVGGPPLASDAHLLMPGGSAPLQVSSAQREEESEASTAVEVVTSQVEISLEVLETVALEQNATGAASFQAALEAALATFQGYIDGCPCALDATSRAEIVRSILRMEKCLSAVHAAATQALEAAQKNHRSYYADTVTRSRISALAFHHLSDTFVQKATVDALLLVLETAYDGLSGGLSKAAAGAISNASSALVDKMQPSEFWGAGDGGGSSIAEATLQDVIKGTALGIGTSGLTSTLMDLLSRGGKHLDLPTFGKKLLEGTVKDAGKKFSPPDLEAFIKSFIKALPALYLDYVKAHTLAVERQAAEAQRLYYESTLTIRDWQSVIAATTSAQARVSAARKDLLDAMARQGCPMTIADGDPCMPALNAALEDARRSLDQEIAAANADIADAVEKLGDTDEVRHCFAGSAANDRAAAELEVANISEEIIERVGEVGVDGIERELEVRLRDAQDAAEEARERWRSACVGAILSGTIDDADALQALAEAQQRKQDALDTYTQEVDAALAAYRQCSEDGGGGGCAGTTTTSTAKDAWSAAMACLECVPKVVMECCGDGVVNGAEACEPGAGDSCAEGYTCSAECTCVCESDDCGGTLPPDDLVMLGSIFGLTTNDLQAKYMPQVITMVQHSADAVGSKPVAGDHTTLTGFALFTSHLDAMVLESVFVTNHPCGTGSGSFTVCPMSTSGAPPVGDYLLLFTTYAGAVPSSSASSYFQYGFVFDGDGNAANNYQAMAPYSNDFFDDTDTWREASYSPGTGWTLKATHAVGSTMTSTSTEARVIFLGSAAVAVIPTSELMTSTPPFRVTAFEHDGNWGLNSGDPWNGSLYPSVANGLFKP